ncbi:MAG: hypothetical protein GF335_05160 [Candidatus Moranbacteria bacterium]|nr:hypothetical protein [Candidatus Moranbacteria bacterium]
MDKIIPFPEKKKPDFEIYTGAVRKINSILEKFPSFPEDFLLKNLEQNLKGHKRLLELLNIETDGKKINGKNVLFSSFSKIDDFFQNTDKLSEKFPQNKKILENFFKDEQDLKEFLRQVAGLSNQFENCVYEFENIFNQEQKDFLSLYWIKLLSDFSNKKYNFNLKPVFKSLIIKDFLDKFQLLEKDLDIFKKWAAKDPYIFGELSKARSQKSQWKGNAEFYYEESEKFLFKGDCDKNIAYMEYLLNNPQYFDDLIDCL